MAKDDNYDEELNSHELEEPFIDKPDEFDQVKIEPPKSSIHPAVYIA